MQNLEAVRESEIMSLFVSVRRAGEESLCESRPTPSFAFTRGEAHDALDAQLLTTCGRPDTLDLLVLGSVVVVIGLVVIMAVFGALSSAYLLKSLANIDLFPGPSPLHPLYEAVIASRP
jgi:hypothetical protein